MMLKNVNKNIKGLSYLIIANILALVVGIASGFIIPKFLGVQEYGYFRVFAFYSVYVGLLNFGFNEGILVRYGGYDYNMLPKKLFRTYFYALMAFQIFICIVGLTLLLTFTKDSNMFFTGIFLLANTIILNLTNFFNNINQVTRKFGLFSKSLALTKGPFIIFTLALWAMDAKNHIFFIAALTLINVLVLVVNMAYTVDLIAGPRQKLKECFFDIRKNFSIGFFIMIGNHISPLMLGLGQMFVERIFPISDFALYSFGVCLLSLITTLSSAIPVVVYPYLARIDKRKINIMYERLERLTLIIFSVSLSSYFVLKLIVYEWLPDYKGAMIVTLLLFPTILFAAERGVVVDNCYKVLKLQKEYTLNNIISVGLATLFIGVAYYFFRTTDSVAAASLVAYYIWLLYSDCFFRKKIKVAILKTHIIQLLITGVFLLSGFLLQWYNGLFVYLLAISFILIVSLRDDLRIMIRTKLNYLKI
jgi:O-antigen/teichoic acid export membrane protein